MNGSRAYNLVEVDQTQGLPAGSTVGAMGRLSFCCEIQKGGSDSGRQLTAEPKSSVSFKREKQIKFDGDNFSPSIN